MRSTALLLALLPALPAATLESALPPPSFQLTLLPSGIASIPELSVSCSGISFPGGHLSISLDSPSPPPAFAKLTFPGANPSCSIRALDPLPGLHANYSPDAPLLPRYTRVVFQQIWPGIDLTFSFIDSHARLTFTLDSLSRLPSLRIRPPQERFVIRTYRDIGDWGYYAPPVRVSATAQSQPVPITVSPDEATPFRLPASLPGPVEITLDLDYPYDIPPSASLRTESGDFYQAFPGIVRKYDATGVFVFQANVDETRVNTLTLAPNGDLLAAGPTGWCCAFFHVLRASNHHVLRLDSHTGLLKNRVVASYRAYLLAVLPNGDLQFHLNTDFPNQLRLGPALPNPCQPRTNVVFCNFIVHTSPDGVITRSYALPSDASPFPAPNGQIYLLRARPAIETLSPSGTSVSTLPLPPGKTYVKLLSDAVSGLWVASTKSLLYFPPNAIRPAHETRIESSAALIPIVEGGVVIANGGPITKDAVVPAPCPDLNDTLTILDRDGSVRHGTYLNRLGISPSTSFGNFHTVHFRHNALTWDRHTLDLEAPPTVAVACLSGAQFAPGQVVKLPVRAVEDESPFQPIWRPGQDLPTAVRGWSIRFDGIPAPIHQLDRTAVTFSVPRELADPPRDSTRMSFWHNNRLLESRIVPLRPEAPTLYEKPRIDGNQVKLRVSGIITPPTASTASRQTIAVTYFAQSPIHPDGIYDLTLYLPETTRPIWPISLLTTNKLGTVTSATEIPLPQIP